MNKIKKVALLFFATTVWAQENPSAVEHWSCGTNCRATLYSDGLFKIEQEDKTGAKAVMNNFSPTTDQNGDWNLNTSPWAHSMKDVTKVIVADGVDHIGNYAFYGARNATDIEISNSVTSIGQCGVGGTGFTHVEIPDSVTSLGIHAFHNMKNLESFVIPSSVTEITQIYQGEIIPTLISFSPNVKKAYCSADVYDFCAQALSNDGMLSLLKPYTKDGNIYIIDGKRYKSIQDYEKGKEIKRIYTVEEATKISKKTGNKFMIRYK